MLEESRLYNKGDIMIKKTLDDWDKEMKYSSVQEIET
jgi:hypothetical protein